MSVLKNMPATGVIVIAVITVLIGHDGSSVVGTAFKNLINGFFESAQNAAKSVP